MKQDVYPSQVNLCSDICRRNNKKRMLWIADQDVFGQEWTKCSSPLVCKEKLYRKQAIVLKEWAVRRMRLMANLERIIREAAVLLTNPTRCWLEFLYIFSLKFSGQSLRAVPWCSFGFRMNILNQ